MGLLHGEKTRKLDPLSPAFRPPPVLPGGAPPKCIPPRPYPAHGAAPYTTGPMQHLARPTHVATTVEDTSADPIRVILLLSTISIMASSNPVANNDIITADDISLWSAIWTSTILHSKLTHTPLNFSPITNFYSYLPLPSPGENYRRNNLSQRRFRRLRRISKLTLMESYLEVRTRFLQMDEERQPTPSPAKIPPHPPTLTVKLLLARTN